MAYTSKKMANTNTPKIKYSKASSATAFDYKKGGNRPTTATGRRKLSLLKNSTYLSSVRLSRLRRLQTLLSTEKGETDALLFILGIDGRYNQGMQELANYLFFGLFETSDQLIRENSRLTEEVFEDFVCVIRINRVDVYCNPINFPFLMPYIMSWKNLRIHCLQENEYENDYNDDVEEFKIHSFVAMVEGCRSIGIPYHCFRHRVAKFDPMVIEQWPLIQAFGLDDFGGAGFFTMKFQVVDLSDSVHTIYNFIDPVAVENIVTEQLSLFEKQWSTMVTICDHHRNFPLTNAVICEPIKTYYDHGSIGCVIEGQDKRSVDCCPFVLFGSDTNREKLDMASRGMSDKRETGLLDSNGSTASHMICQAVSPRGQIFCRRTYFFAADSEFLNVSSNAASEDCGTDINHSPAEIRTLIAVYKACEAAVLEAIRVYSFSLNTNKAENAAREALLNCCSGYNIPELDVWLSKRENVVITLDHHAQHTNLQQSLPSDTWLAIIKHAEATVYDIPSCCKDHPLGHRLGSVSFAESFVDSAFLVHYTDDHSDLNGLSAILTSALPQYINWSMNDAGKKNLESIMMSLEEKELPSFGIQLMAGHSATLGHVNGLSPNLFHDGKLYIYENLIVFIHEHIPPIIFPLLSAVSLAFYDGNSSSVVTCIASTCEDSFARKYLPTYLCSNGQNQILFFLTPKSKAHRAFFAEVLPIWKKQNTVRPSLLNLDNLPEDLVIMHNQLQEQYLTSSGNEESGLHRIKIQNFKNFLNHLLISSAGEQTISSLYLDALIGEQSVPYIPQDVLLSDQTVDDKKVIVTVLVGSPGSHRDNLCKNLMKANNYGKTWFFVQSLEPFDANNLQNSLETIWNKQQHTNGKLRVIVLLSGLTDIVNVIYAIQNHSNYELAKLLSVGAVTVCINHKDAFMEHCYIMPKLLDNCAKGWANNICWTSMSFKDTQSDILQQMIRSANDDVHFIVADGGLVTRNSDLDLICSETSFNHPAHIKSQFLSCPGWSVGKYKTGSEYPEMKRILLKFDLPLNRSRLINHLRGLRKNLEKYPFCGNVYYVEGKLYFAGSSQMQVLTYATLPDSMSICPVDVLFDQSANGNNSESFLLFTGCLLDQSTFKKFLGECTSLKREKQTFRTRESLTEAEIKRVHKDHHLDELPEGWFYNGNQYVCLDGERSDTHPNIEIFLRDYLTKCNEEIVRYNATVDDNLQRTV